MKKYVQFIFRKQIRVTCYVLYKITHLILILYCETTTFCSIKYVLYIENVNTIYCGQITIKPGRHRGNNLVMEYSELPLRRTRSGPAPTVRLREVSTLEGDEVND